ncbi:hypothetical protein [Gordonia soli]|uniref:Uncharacterized protein n=1 Tax=Gordonia soli NBRC 108243 TaxID=1223545 RepID=M0QQZ3_9ACTN|nr:hypothetical protein [Gordonia soli]GAC70809.1 hypothetical protein GS4_41_00570 [Gordonia soli NBRC 108243]
MTFWTVNLTRAQANIFARTGGMVLLTLDGDYQKGDTLAIYEGVRHINQFSWSPSTVEHVLKHAPGLESGYVVLTLNNRKAERAEREAETSRGLALRRERSNVALRGQITKLRRQLAGGGA